MAPWLDVWWRLTKWCRVRFETDYWRLAWAAYRMRGLRVDYYAFLATRLRDGDGVTLRALFDKDAARYGLRHPRGWLSAYWARRCQQHGGALASLWAGVFPVTELRLLQIGQQGGSEMLAQTLHDLARALTLIQSLRAGVSRTLAAAVAASLVFAAMLLAVPAWTAPHLAALVEGVPPAYLGGAIRTLFTFAAALTVGWPLLVFLLALIVLVLPWTFSYAQGRLRKCLDQLAPWRLQRDFHAVRWLALLQVMLQPRAGVVLPLRDQLDLLWDVSPPWLQWHLGQMRQALTSGEPVTAIFATGLFSRELRWLLDDLVAAHGLVAGMAQVRSRLEAHIGAQVLARAHFWRWILLLGAAAGALLILLWHYAAIDELRSALLQAAAAGVA